MIDKVSVGVVATRILEIRGKKVMLDRDLAYLYGVTTKVLNQAVKRNIKRFPDDFMFRLTKTEKNELVTNCDQFKMMKHSTALPYVFTEQGIAMLSSVLNSDRAIRVNIQIMRAFVQIRKLLITNVDLRRKIEAMEKKYDKQFVIVFQALKQLLEPPKRTHAIGFHIRSK